MRRHGHVSADIAAWPGPSPTSCRVHGRFFGVARALGEGTHDVFITENKAAHEVEGEDDRDDGVAVDSNDAPIVDHEERCNVESRYQGQKARIDEEYHAKCSKVFQISLHLEHGAEVEKHGDNVYQSANCLRP